MIQKVGIIGGAGSFLTLILEIVSLATPNWLEIVGGSIGLWQGCVDRIGCSSISSNCK